jgi:hypothetical protein
MRPSESKDTSESIIPVPLLNPKFANVLAAMVCELRVRGTGRSYWQTHGCALADPDAHSMGFAGCPTAFATGKATAIADMLAEPQ